MNRSPVGEEPRGPARTVPGGAPIAGSTRPPEVQWTSGRPLARFDTARLVIVDDTPRNIEALVSALTAAGLRDVRILPDPRHTLDTLARLEPDLVLLNLHLTDTDGYHLLEQMVRQAAGTYLPVVAMTGAPNVAAAHRALATGARDVLTRPIDNTDAVLRIGNLLETRELHQQLRRVSSQLAEDLGKLQHQQHTDERSRQAKTDAVLAALTEDGFHVVFQPIVDLPSGVTVGYEALSRFDVDPDRAPQQWFADAAEVGLGYALELDALSRALDALPRLPTTAYLAVNISAETLLHPELLMLINPDIAPRLVLDLVEHLPVEDYGSICRALARLRHRGVRLAVDDTGAGYASLRHILTLVPDIIKLDASVVRNIHLDPARRALAAALVSFAAEVGTELIAEGVEATDELHTLRDLGITRAQGYLLGRPAPLN